MVYRKKLEVMKPEDFSKSVAAMLTSKEVGFSGLNPEDIKRIQEGDPQNLDMLTNLVSKLKFFSDVAKERKGQVSGTLAANEAAVIKGAIDDLIVQTAFADEAPSKYKAPSDAKDDKTKKQVFTRLMKKNKLKLMKSSKRLTSKVKIDAIN